MKAYFFVNCYLSDIQRGIQPAHAVAEMFTKYDGTANRTTEYQTNQAKLYEWARTEKTMVVLNGGPQSRLEHIAGLLETQEEDIPWSYFIESEDALNGALTCVGLIADEQLCYSISEAKNNPWTNNILQASREGSHSDSKFQHREALYAELAKGKTA